MSQTLYKLCVFLICVTTRVRVNKRNAQTVCKLKMRPVFHRFSTFCSPEKGKHWFFLHFTVDFKSLPNRRPRNMRVGAFFDNYSSPAMSLSWDARDIVDQWWRLTASKDERKNPKQRENFTRSGEKAFWSLIKTATCRGGGRTMRPH